MSFDAHIEAGEEIASTEQTAPRLQHMRRNIVLFFLDMVIWGTAVPLIGATTVVPDFIRHLTDSVLIIGLAGSIYNVAWLLPQLFVAQIINRATHRQAFMTWTVIPFRLIMTVVALSVAVIGADSHLATLLIFLFGYTLFAAGDGFVTVVWADLIGTSIPDRWRGVMFGGSQFVVAFTALIVQAVVRHLLGPNGPAFPQNYAQVIGIAAALFFVAGICLTSLREEKHQAPAEAGPMMHEYFPYLGNVLRTDKAFRQFVITRFLLDMTLLASPFYIILGIDRLNVPSDVLVGDSILFATIGSALASLVMSWLSHRYGSRAVIKVLGVSSILHPAFGLLALFIGYPALYGTFFMLGFAAAATTAGYFDWIITYAPPARRPIYIGLTSTLSAFSHLAPLLGGLILATTSYPVMFVVALVMAVLGLVASFSLIEPRKQAQL